MHEDGKIVPCELCGEPSAFPRATQCHNCWEVCWRLDHFMKSEKGRAFVLAKLDEAYPMYKFKVECTPTGRLPGGARNEKIERFRKAYSGGSEKDQTPAKSIGIKNAVIQMSIAENMERAAIVAEFKIPPPGEPNANGDIFPADQIYEVGKPVHALGSDEPIGVIERVDGAFVTVRMRGDPPIFPASECVSMSSKSSIAGTVEKLEVDWDNLSEFACPTTVAHLVDGVRLKEILENKDFSITQLPIVNRVHLEGFEATHSAPVRDPAYPGAVIRPAETIAEAMRVGFIATPSDLSCDYEEVVNRMFGGDQHLVCFVDGKLSWICENIAIVEYKMVVTDKSNITLQNPKFAMRLYRAFTQDKK